MVITFAMIVALLPQDAYAYNVESINTMQTVSDESGSDSDAVLAYYDVETQTETLLTEKDLQDTISNARKRNRSIGTTVEPQSAVEPHTIQNLTEDEIEQFDEAADNTREYYGETASNMRAIDNRTLVSNPQADPYYRMAKLYYTQKTNASGTTSGGYMGTGFAVGYNLCATARHCITDDYGNWSTDFKAYYGYNGYNNTYCDLLDNVWGYIYYPQYITGKSSNGKIQVDMDYDIAFVIWGERTVEETGCLGMSSEISNGMSLITAGYPGDRDNGYRMYRAAGNVTSFTNLRLKCDNIYCYPGQSGSAYYDAGLYAHGVITHTDMLSNDVVSGESSGRRFDATLIQWLQSNGYV